MRILIWATHLQTDVLALACHFDRCPDVELLIVTPDKDAFLRTPFARIAPLGSPLLDRNDPDTLARIRAFRADLAVADNHVPPKGSAPRLFYMWHGMGWKARSRIDLEIFYRQVRTMIGRDPREPGAPFLAQCYGPTDLDWRARSWGLPADACATIGMPFAELLSKPRYTKENIASEYEVDVMGRKTVLLAITWHYGGIFAEPPGVKRSLRGLAGSVGVNPRDATFLHDVVAAVGARGANLLICLHDRQRYDTAFLGFLQALADQHEFVEIRSKSDHPDNLSDLLAADVMLSNLSSFLTYFYLLGRPALHIIPTSSTSEVERMVMLFSRFRLRRKVNPAEAWMLEPSDTGGPVVSNGEEAVATVCAALDDPGYGTAARDGWLARHLPIRDGLASRRFEDHARKLCARALPLAKSKARLWQVPNISASLRRSSAKGAS